MRQFDAITLLRRLVEIESPSGREARAVAFLVEQMRNLGLQAHVDEVGNAVAVREKPDMTGNIRRELLLLGHIDTVPGRVPVRMDGGRLFGRGTVDAKGPLAAFVLATAEASLPAGTRVVVIGAVEEECATSRGAHHVARQYRPDGCIIGEPSGVDTITLGYKGSLQLQYELQQPEGHSAGPVPTVAEQAVAFWSDVQTFARAHNQGRTRLFQQLLPTLRQLHSTSDGLTARIVAHIGLRLPPGFDVEEFLHEANSFADQAQLRTEGFLPAFQSARRSYLVRAFSRAIRQQDAQPRLTLKTGTSDMNVVGPRWNCPIVAFGPGDSNLDHTPDEHIHAGEFLRSIEVLKVVLADLDAEETETYLEQRRGGAVEESMEHGMQISQEGT